MYKFVILVNCLMLCFAAIPERKIIRPCDLHDLHCIRENLAANSRCNKHVSGSIPGAYNLARFTFHTPFFNATYVDEFVTIRNQDKCYVSEFFFNMERDTAVLSVDCPDLGVAANRTLIQHCSLQEDTSYSYIIEGIYPLIRLTTNLKHADHLDLCSAHTFADVTALPIFKIDPNNMPTANFLSRDLAFLNIYERETFFYRGPQLMKTYVNSLICNFGCY